MKKILVCLLAAMLLVGCSSQHNSNQQSNNNSSVISNNENVVSSGNKYISNVYRDVEFPIAYDDSKSLVVPVPETYMQCLGSEYSNETYLQFKTDEGKVITMWSHYSVYGDKLTTDEELIDNHMEMSGLIFYDVDLESITDFEICGYSAGDYDENLEYSTGEVDFSKLDEIHKVSVMQGNLTYGGKTTNKAVYGLSFTLDQNIGENDTYDNLEIILTFISSQCSTDELREVASFFTQEMHMSGQFKEFDLDKVIPLNIGSDISASGKSKIIKDRYFDFKVEKKYGGNTLLVSSGASEIYSNKRGSGSIESILHEVTDDSENKMYLYEFNDSFNQRKDYDSSEDLYASLKRDFALFLPRYLDTIYSYTEEELDETNTFSLYYKDNIELMKIDGYETAVDKFTLYRSGEKYKNGVCVVPSTDGYNNYILTAVSDTLSSEELLDYILGILDGNGVFNNG